MSDKLKKCVEHVAPEAFNAFSIGFLTKSKDNGALQEHVAASVMYETVKARFDEVFSDKLAALLNLPVQPSDEDVKQFIVDMAKAGGTLADEQFPPVKS